MNDSKSYWIGFNLVKGIGAARLRGLLDYFGDITAAWQASAIELASAGLSPRLAEGVVRVRESDALPKALESIQAEGITVLTWEDELYPNQLKDIDQPPPVLYLRGSLLPEDDWAVAIVGTRRITAYGRQVAEEISAQLARNRIAVVSGLARGVDSIAHQAAVNANGRTLAVLGCGVDRIYPPENRRLAEQIIKQGALISDYPPGTAPDAANFPPRNRIISGLARAVLVVEAGENSGALITANFAEEQNRPVFAVPGSIYAPQSQGANRLIQRGARLLLNVQDILEMLNVAQLGSQLSVRAVLPADATEAQLYGLLNREPLHIDEIRLKSGLPIEKVSATLSIMELKGLARQVGGMRYVAVRDVNEDYQISNQL